MEFGPRALGARSILGDPRSPAMQATMNLKIKFRESFRRSPRPSSRSGRPSGSTSSPARRARTCCWSPRSARTAGSPIDAEALRDHAGRSRPAAPGQRGPLGDPGRHPRRLQRPDPDRRRRSATRGSTRLLEAFDRLTGCPVLVNTSFNVRGEPIVCTPEDAYRCFLATDMDVLVLEDFVIVKDAAARQAGEGVRERYLAQFQLD